MKIIKTDKTKNCFHPVKIGVSCICNVMNGECLIKRMAKALQCLIVIINYCSHHTAHLIIFAGSSRE